MTNLPDELSRLILSKCGQTDLAALRRTCKTMRGAVGPLRFTVRDYLDTPRTVRWAARHLGMPLNAATFAAAARTSNLSVLKTLRSLKCGHDSRVCTNLARRDHVTGLRWARDEGFAWNFLCCSAAVDAESARTVRWLGNPAVECPCGGTYHEVGVAR